MGEAVPRLDDIQPLFPSTHCDRCFTTQHPEHGSEDAWRHLIRNRGHNGLEERAVIFKTRDRWHIVVPRYVEWLMSQSTE